MCLQRCIESACECCTPLATLAGFANCSAESRAAPASALAWHGASLAEGSQSAQNAQDPFRRAASATAEDIAAQLESIGLEPVSSHDSLAPSYQNSGTADTMSGTTADGSTEVENSRQPRRLQPMQQPAGGAWSLGPTASLPAWSGDETSRGEPSHKDSFSDLGEFSSLDDYGQLKRRGPPR